MRLIREIPEAEAKIASGELSLSNVCQAQSFFREIEKTTKAPINKAAKIQVLRSLVNKSGREGQKELLKISPLAGLPKERERVITDDQSEGRFLMSHELKNKLDEVRSLAGPKGATMNYAELIEFMTVVSAKVLREKKFGKKHVRHPEHAEGTPTPPRSEVKVNNPRYIPKSVVCEIYSRDGHRCTNCGATKNLNIDHIFPVAKGGTSEVENLRLLCFSCNQRAAVQEFGVFELSQ